MLCKLNFGREYRVGGWGLVVFGVGVNVVRVQSLIKSLGCPGDIWVWGFLFWISEVGESCQQHIRAWVD